MTFSSEVQPGLEFVDILTNAPRRALIGNLQREGSQNIHRLMLHENGSPYLSFVVFHEGQDIVQDAAYANTVREGFSKDGRLVLTKRNMQIAIANENPRPIIAV
jgi:hypothetical protein